MIITRVPYRVSFLGGGSDLKEFYSQTPGRVLNVTINKYMYISTHSFFDKDRIQAKYSQTENVGNVNQLKHPIIREVLKQLNIPGGIEISSIADIPSGTGLGSSSAFTVSLLLNLYRKLRKDIRKADPANEACKIEIDVLKEPIGKQDQFAITFGGLNEFEFLPSGEVKVMPISVETSFFNHLQDSLMLFFTGKQRSTSSILAEQQNNIRTKSKFAMMEKMVSFVGIARSALEKSDLGTFGEVMHEGWQLKRNFASKITTPEIDEIYNIAMKNGAIGGKLLGAGGGGFMLFVCTPENQPRIQSALSFLRQVSFRFEEDGAKVVYETNEAEE